jgi:rod shape-determining protein MreC
VRNIFLFIRRYFNFLFFVILQVIALSFLFRYNRFHEAAFMGVANEVTGRVSEQYSNVEYYFHLKRTNAALAKENERLNNLLLSNFAPSDTSSRIVVDSIKVDSLEQYRRYRYYPASVVESFTAFQTNYLMIHRGSNQGIKPDMGVISPLGIVGRIVNVSENYSTAMSVLNRQFKTNAKLIKGGERGSIEWDGKDPQFVYLKDIPKSAAVAKGDTVMTSELSSIFPPNIMVGTVQEIINNKSSNFYTLKLKTSTNFYSVFYVYIIEDLHREERKQLQEETKKNQ